MRLVIRLNDLLKQRDMTQKQLAEITGIRPAAISEICNNQRTSINREHLEKIAMCLKLKDINELVTFEN